MDGVGERHNEMRLSCGASELVDDPSEIFIESKLDPKRHAGFQ